MKKKINKKSQEGREDEDNVLVRNISGHSVHLGNGRKICKNECEIVSQYLAAKLLDLNLVEKFDAVELK